MKRISAVNPAVLLKCGFPCENVYQWYMKAMQNALYGGITLEQGKSCA